MEKLRKVGFNKISGTIAEIGPGDTLGVGICALLDGFKKYYAFDIIAHASIDNNLKILLQLKNYFQLHSTKIKEIIAGIKGENDLFHYFPNCQNKGSVEENSLDLILSNAVMEHVFDISSYYKIMFDLLKPGGYCSHVIDYKALEFSKIWYEHWYLNKTIWKFLMHGRMYFINRLPHSYHISTQKNIGYEILLEEKIFNEKANFKKISKEIRKYFTEEDLSISSAHVIARKPE
ncbi:methyltransferase domain-containing protein [Melioribacter sp. OK-6-Me]|uniref:class I SAM-dependent methyltransferase n=1 Tax=Melioribacter sp. OK-6-Me TaxID=3423433 RepID=UPI003ED94199